MVTQKNVFKVDERILKVKKYPVFHHCQMQCLQKGKFVNERRKVPNNVINLTKKL